MFVVTLRFADKSKAPGLVDAHNAWVGRGFEDGVFLLAGGIRPNAGGAILAHGTSPEALEARVREDPFVAEGVVVAEILAVSPVRTDERLAFLKGLDGVP